MTLTDAVLICTWLTIWAFAAIEEFNRCRALHKWKGLAWSGLWLVIAALPFVVWRYA